MGIPLFRVTISLPIFGRPQRTIRALESIFAQTVKEYELLVTSDGCSFWNKTENVRNLQTWFHQQMKDNPKCSIVLVNNQKHRGCWGAAIRNEHILDALGKNFMFMGSDDILRPNHLEDKLYRIEGTGKDFMYADTWVEPYKAPRNAQLQQGMIGHSELMISSYFLKKMPPHSNQYGHDWELVKNMMYNSNLYSKAERAPQTYVVMSVPGNEEQGID